MNILLFCFVFVPSYTYSWICCICYVFLCACYCDWVAYYYVFLCLLTSTIAFNGSYYSTSSYVSPSLFEQHRLAIYRMFFQVLYLLQCSYVPFILMKSRNLWNRSFSKDVASCFLKRFWYQCFYFVLLGAGYPQSLSSFIRTVFWALLATFHLIFGFCYTR